MQREWTDGRRSRCSGGRGMVQRHHRNSTAQRHISSPTPVPSASQHIKSAGRQAGTRSGTAGTCVWCGAVRHLLSGVPASSMYGSTADELARKRRSATQGRGVLALPPRRRRGICWAPTNSTQQGSVPANTSQPYPPIRTACSMRGTAKQVRRRAL